jgi:DNA-binding transcriptional LysR family regulator
MGRSEFSSPSTTELFCKAAEKLNFTAAAQALGTTPSAISKAVRRLENRLGVELFKRTTRSIRLTDEGQAYFVACQQALAQIRQSEEMLRQSRQGSSGTLRISVPVSYGIKRLVALIPEYLQRYPGRVKVFISLSNSVTDFIGEEFDMAIRIGRVADSRLVARPLHQAHLCVVASPDYLRKYGWPRRPEDLAAHQSIDLVLPDSGKPLPWRFAEARRHIDIKPTARLELDHPIAVLTAACNGAGIARLLDFTVASELRTGELVEVLREFRLPAQPVSVAYPSGRHLPARMRTFLDYLLEVAGEHRL